MDKQENLPHSQLNNGSVPPPCNGSGQTPSTPPEPEPTIRQWLERNAISLLFVAALFAFVFGYLQWDPWLVAKVAVGLSFVIFFHELGHFLVAKWCDVHVTTFSIGFGPAIPGCSFQRGETTYKLALFPLGGYVQMVGQVDGDESADGSEDDPRSYRNKTVLQRMAIISAGVIMNVILAVVCFVLVFQGPGKDRPAGVINSVEAGSAAFVHGLRTGAEILQVGDVKRPNFEELMIEVVATGHGQKIFIETRQAGDPRAAEYEIEPRLSRTNTRPMLGISPPFCPTLKKQRLLPRTFAYPVYRESAADHAQPAFQFEDQIIATSDPDNPKKIKDLPPDPRKPNSKQRDYFEFARRMKRLASQEVVIRVERRCADSADKTEVVDIRVPPAWHHTFGVRMKMGEITSLRLASPADKAGVQARNKDTNLQGDIILGVEAKRPDGTWLRLGDRKPLKPLPASKPLDPLRLPFELQQWADQLHANKKDPTEEERTVVVYVQRHRSKAGEQFDYPSLKLVWDRGWRFDKIEPFVPSAPLAIAELGLAYQVKTTVADVESGLTGKEDSLQKEDLIKKVRFHFAGENGAKESGPWMELEPDEFAHVFWSFQIPGTLKVVDFQVERNKETKEFRVQAGEDAHWPVVERGLILSNDVRRQKANDILEAVTLGVRDTRNMIIQVFQNLRGMLTGRISVKNLGGPIMIAQIAYRFAGFDFWEFIFFIGMISANLAVINFLPIPVLDGGHMVFLIYEKIRGKPASEGVRIGATYAGLALILCLMVFVLYQDISRLFRG